MNDFTPTPAYDATVAEYGFDPLAKPPAPKLPARRIANDSTQIIPRVPEEATR